MKAIMYHYVRKYSEDYPQFKYLDFDNFCKQLDYFEENYGFASKESWSNFVSTGVITKELEGKVILTFDDAMACHFDLVYPELLARGLWGIFYVPSFPYINRKMLDVHRIHLLTGKFNGVLLLKKLSSFLTDKSLTFGNVESFSNSTYVQQNNARGVSEFKRLLNYYIDENEKTYTINSVCAALNFYPKFEEFYVAENNLETMVKNGMLIGSHSSSHSLMSKLSREQQFKELKESIDFIRKVNQLKCDTYCHPFGGDHSFNSDTVDLLEKLNINYAFSVEPRDINAKDFINKRFALPRYDCNKFPHGQVAG